jgi:hypothetical protein
MPARQAPHRGAPWRAVPFIGAAALTAISGFAILESLDSSARVAKPAWQAVAWGWAVLVGITLAHGWAARRAVDLLHSRPRSASDRDGFIAIRGAMGLWLVPAALAVLASALQTSSVAAWWVLGISVLVWILASDSIVAATRQIERGSGSPDDRPTVGQVVRRRWQAEARASDVAGPSSLAAIAPPLDRPTLDHTQPPDAERIATSQTVDRGPDDGARAAAPGEGALSEDAELIGPLDSDEGLVQRWERRTTAEVDGIYGWMLVSIPDGQRAVVEHVGFCPPLIPLAQVTAEADTSDVQVKVAEVMPQGVRLEIMRRGTNDLRALQASIEFAAESSIEGGTITDRIRPADVERQRFTGDRSA